MSSPIRRIPRTSSHASIVAREWADYLDTMGHDEFVSYVALHELTGVSPQERRGLLETARQIVQRRSGKVFDVVIGEGLICLSEGGKLGYVDKRIQRVHTATKKTMRAQGTVDIDALTPLEKHRHLGQLSVSMIVLFGSDPKTARALEAKPSQEPIMVNPADYKELFKGL